MSAMWTNGSHAADARRIADRIGAELGAPKRIVLSRLAEHVRRNVARRIRVDELAHLAGISALQLARAFRREHAKTPYAFVLEIRIGYAKALLAAGRTIADVAAESGFADQSHFTRQFRRRVGMTPREYLRSYS
ncbi:MAG TPA: AraC family transcriptional regulator [Casimicrobiaceae bacterium]|nr:AraC family transcriptional regulator [Casimicrobiaceae bacterium]